jgi:hypothetical protein
MPRKDLDGCSPTSAQLDRDRGFEGEAGVYLEATAVTQCLATGHLVRPQPLTTFVV